MNYRKTIFSGVVISSAALSGCATMDDSQRTTFEGAAIGSILGGVIGHQLGGRDGAAIGVLLGGTAGGVIGSKVAAKKREYATAEDFYSASIVQVSKENRALVKENRRLRQDVIKINKDIAIAKNSANSSAKRTQSLMTANTELAARTKKNKSLIKHYKGELAYANEVLKDLNKSSSQNSSKHTQLKKQITSLRRNISELERSNNQLASLDPSML